MTPIELPAGQPVTKEVAKVVVEPERGVQNTDQRILVVKAIIAQEQVKAHSSQKQNTNLELMLAAFGKPGETQITMPSGLVLVLQGFNKETGEATFTRKDKSDAKPVVIKLGHLYRNIKNQGIVDNLQDDQKRFVKDTFGDIGEKQASYQPRLDAPLPSELQHLAESLGLMTVRDIRQASSIISQQIVTETATVQQVMKEFPPGASVATPDILDHTLSQIIKEGEKAQRSADALRRLITQAGEHSPLYAFLKKQLEQATRLQKIAEGLKAFHTDRIIQYYRSVSNGDLGSIRTLNDTITRLLKCRKG